MRLLRLLLVVAASVSVHGQDDLDSHSTRPSRRARKEAEIADRLAAAANQPLTALTVIGEGKPPGPEAPNSLFLECELKGRRNRRRNEGGEGASANNRRSRRKPSKGVCSYITDPNCSELYDLVTKGERLRRAVRKVKKAIKAPCGFDGSDYTICCPNVTAVRSAPVDDEPQCGVVSHSTILNVPDLPHRLSRRQAEDIEAFIVGGQLAAPRNYPFAAALIQVDSSSGEFAVVCGGTLIASRWVLTAAHCFPGDDEGDSTTVRLGQQDLLAGGGQDIGVCDVIKHPRFRQVGSSGAVADDIALVELCSDVDFSLNIRTACLPEAKNEIPPEKLTVIGWGSTEKSAGTAVDELREAQVELVPLSECQNSYESLVSDSVSRRHLCAGRGERDTCNGDSGGPLLAQKDGVWTVYGVTSFGFECANSQFPGVYASVSKYVKWIQKKIQ